MEILSTSILSTNLGELLLWDDENGMIVYSIIDDHNRIDYDDDEGAENNCDERRKIGWGFQNRPRRSFGIQLATTNIQYHSGRDENDIVEGQNAIAALTERKKTTTTNCSSSSTTLAPMRVVDRKPAVKRKDTEQSSSQHGSAPDSCSLRSCFVDPNNSFPISYSTDDNCSSVLLTPITPRRAITRTVLSASKKKVVRFCDEMESMQIPNCPRSDPLFDSISDNNDWVFEKRRTKRTTERKMK